MLLLVTIKFHDTQFSMKYEESLHNKCDVNAFDAMRIFFVGFLRFHGFVMHTGEGLCFKPEINVYTGCEKCYSFQT